jgi:hypothetical protein
MEIPNWLASYIDNSQILQTLVQWLQNGLSDIEIGRRWQCSAHHIHQLRCRWRLFRSSECPHCGSKDYLENICPERRCISNWPEEFFKNKEKNK